jgi:hypothetical protein
MNELIGNFLHTRQINSFQKLRILLVMDQDPHRVGTYHQWAKWLYLGDTPLLEQILEELQQVGLITYEQGHWTLADEAEIKPSLKALGKLFNDPLTRQQLLQQVSRLGSGFLYLSTPPADMPI